MMAVVMGNLANKQAASPAPAKPAAVKPVEKPKVDVT